MTQQSDEAMCATCKERIGDNLVMHHNCIEKSFRNFMCEKIGEASMCWSKIPNGIFDSTRASQIIDDIFDAFHLDAGMNVTRWVELNRANKTLKAENKRLKATIKHHKEGTIFCPNCGERGIKDEFITNCVCGASWMTAHQAELHSIYERDHLRQLLKEARDLIEKCKPVICTDCHATYDEFYPDCPSCGSVYGLTQNMSDFEKIKKTVIELSTKLDAAIKGE